VFVINFRALFILLRPWQWIKNLLIFIPLIFALELFNYDFVIKAIWGFISLCLISSAVYCINDVFDSKIDATHPVKKLRPVSSGEVTKFQAIFAAILCIILAFIPLIATFNLSFIILVSAYFAMNMGYSWIFNKKFHIGIMIVATGFVIRVLSGSLVIGVEISEWLILVTFTAAVFISLLKRRKALVMDLDDNNKLDNDITLTDHYINITAGLLIVLYCLWTMIGQTVITKNNLIFTIPLVMYSIFKFLAVMTRPNAEDDPSKLFIKDKSLLCAVFAWICLCIILLYIDFSQLL
jgi:4-hydroxybenzoate polyprenyltransferase